MLVQRGLLSHGASQVLNDHIRDKRVIDFITSFPLVTIRNMNHATDNHRNTLLLEPGNKMHTLVNKEIRVDAVEDSSNVGVWQYPELEAAAFPLLTQV
jgi:hypothetical protein